ncbi:hypothetical protein U1Q18_001248, partial [Sarracenia purpurea var. burkii]
KNAENCYKLTMDRNNIVMELRTRDHLLVVLKDEMNALRAELEKERAEFEGKVVERIE